MHSAGGTHCWQIKPKSKSKQMTQYTIRSMTQNKTNKNFAFTQTQRKVWTNGKLNNMQSKNDNETSFGSVCQMPHHSAVRDAFGGRGRRFDDNVHHSHCGSFEHSDNTVRIICGLGHYVHLFRIESSSLHFRQEKCSKVTAPVAAITATLDKFLLF